MDKKIIILLVIAILLGVVSATTAVFLFNKPKSYAHILENTRITKTPKPENIRIGFFGDLMFDRGIRYYAGQNGGNDFIFDKISGFLKQNDLNVANLEGSITSNKSVSAGSVAGSTNNYYLTFDPSVAETLFSQNIKLVDLGNNHILNFGYNGLAQTKKYLEQAHVDYFGAPNYPKSVSAQIKGVKITFISYNQFADLPLETEQLSTIEEIQKAKQYSDIIVVFCHWGIEYQKNQSPEQTILAHQFIDNGADLVIGSHPHVVQPSEDYNGKKIYYSLGNFIFDQYFSKDVRNGLGVILSVNLKTKKLTYSEQKTYLQTGGQTIILPKP